MMAAPTDIPIDPALLEEEQAIDCDLEDAEGEIVDDTIDVEYQWPPKGHYDDPHATGRQFDVIHAQSTYDGYYDEAPREAEIYADSPSSRPARSTSRPIPFDELPHHQSHSQYYSHYPPPASSPSVSSQPKRGRPPKSNSHDTLNGVRPPKPKHKVLAGSSKHQAGPSTPLHKTKSKAWKRDILCSFCRLGDMQNEKGVPQVMATCHRCGRSGHPSCMSMTASLAKKVMQYQWKCQDCKNCEACETKGDDARLLFCDGCDRGWHSYCLNPPLARPPQGKWHCPLCVAEKSQPSTSQIKLNVNVTSAKGKGKAIDPSSLPRNIPSAPSSTPRPRGRPRKDAQPAYVPPDHEDEGEYSVFTDRRPTIKIKPQRRKKQSTAMSDTDREEDNPVPPRFRIRLRVGSGAGGKPVEVESEEEKVPYGGVITGDDADTSKTSITEKDKEYFEKTRSVAESKLGGPPPVAAPPAGQHSPAPSSINGYFATPPPRTPAPSKSAYRPLRNQVLQQSFELGTPGFSTPNGSSSAIVNGGTGHSEKISKIRFGVFDIDTWYSAPYPEEYQHVPDGRLWLCEFCLKYMKTGFVAGRHRMKCKARHPPGDEIYRKDNVVVFEVDGRKNKIYCQNLCLLAKMFLDHKTLYYDVEPFLFYVMTEVDELGARFVGYFSKEKRSPDNNVSCIMTLPVRQRKGWGQLLIDFSYLLSKKEVRVGGPERPLSGLGEVTYKKYWSLSVFRHLHNAPDNPTLEDISKATSMTLTDVYSTLNEHDMIHDLASPPRSTHDTQTPTPGSWRRGRVRGRARGPRLSAPRRSTNKNTHRSPTPESEDKDKLVIPARYVIRWDRDYVDALLKQHDQKGYLELAPERLKYHPFLVTRNPAKPPGAIAKATLMANNPNAVHAAEMAHEQDGEDLASKSGDHDDPILLGEDQATLDLVKALANESPQRSLRKRTSSELNSTPLQSVKRLRSMDERNMKSASPKSPSKSTRQSRRYESLPEGVDLHNRNGHANGRSRSRLQDAAEIGMDEDAEGEEEEPVEDVSVQITPKGHPYKHTNGSNKVDTGEESDDPLRLDTPNAKQRQKGELQKRKEIQEDVSDEDADAEGEDEDAEGEDDEEYIGDEEDAEGEDEDEEYVE